jgi:hypothetical protein
VARHALYFPTIRVPHTDWFVRTLLYWDAVGAIVPAKLARKPAMLGTRMLNYVDYGLVKVVEPDRYLSYRPEFHEEFLATLEGLTGLDRRRNEFARALRDREHAKDIVRLHADKLTRIHTGKTDFGLLDELQRRGLATVDSGPEGPAWWLIEAEVARRYMAALSRLLSGVEEEGKPPMDPVTDRPEDLEALGRVDAAFAERLGAIRTEMLSVALPSVSGPVSAFDLSDFKKRYGSFLVDFRQEVEARAISIAQEERAAVREAKRRNALEGLGNDIAKIERLLGETPWKVNRKGTLLRLTASVLFGAAKTAVSPPAALDEVPKVKKAIDKAFRPESDGSGAGRTAYAALARRDFARDGLAGAAV